MYLKKEALNRIEDSSEKMYQLYSKQLLTISNQ